MCGQKPESARFRDFIRLFATLMHVVAHAQLALEEIVHTSLCFFWSCMCYLVRST